MTTGGPDRRLLAAAQLGPASPSKAETRDRMLRLLAAAAANGVDLVVFPELALTPYFPVALHNTCEPFLDSLADLQPLYRAIARHGLHAVIPFAERTPDGYFNSSALVGPDGEVIGLYRKVHLPGRVDPAQPGITFEKRYFRPGNLGFPVYRTAAGPVGMLICADRSFPESWRCLGLNGARLVAAPYNTSIHVPHHRQPGGKPDEAALREQQALRMRAGASMNGYYVVAAGKAGVEHDIPYIGDSMVISPWGEILARAATATDELVVAEADLQQAAEAQGLLGLSGGRVPSAYGPICEHQQM